MTESTPAPHLAALSPETLLQRCRVDRRRGGGPGGQHRNVTETAVVLREPETGLTGQAGERRSQRENQRRALFRLRLNLALQVRGDFRPGRPSELWQSRRRGQALEVNARHEDFPAILAEAMDVIVANRWEVTQAARQLGVTTSQLTKLLKKHPEALEQVNQHRRERGKHTLK